jgi:hypothetical protein
MYFIHLNLINIFILGKRYVKASLERLGKINEIPVMGIPEDWYLFVKSAGKAGTCPKSFEDAEQFIKSYEGKE